MRHPFDQFAKQLLEEALTGTGRVETEVEVPAVDTQHADVAYVPDVALEAKRRALGLLGEMTAEPCLFEAFHDPPRLAEVRDCLRKQLTMHHGEVVQARRGERPPPADPPLLWVISSGRPEGVIQSLALSLLDGWPGGFYSAAVGLRLRLVVANELAGERRTLILRLMGSGRVLKRAIAELLALPADAWERIAVPPLIRLRLTIPADPALRSREDEEVAVTTMDIYEEWKQRMLAEGQAQGEAKGEAKGEARGRASALLKVLVARGFEISPEQRAEIAACTDLEKLDLWISRAATAKSPADVLSDG